MAQNCPEGWLAMTVEMGKCQICGQVQVVDRCDRCRRWACAECRSGALCVDCPEKNEEVHKMNDIKFAVSLVCASCHGELSTTFDPHYMEIKVDRCSCEDKQIFADGIDKGWEDCAEFRKRWDRPVGKVADKVDSVEMARRVFGVVQNDQKGR